MSVSRENYVETVLRAFEGEAYGEDLFGALADGEAADEISEIWCLIRDMERLTRERLLPIVLDSGATPTDLVERGQKRAREEIPLLCGKPWRDVVEHFLPRTPSALERYESLQRIAPEAHREPIGQLRGHGQAFAECMRQLHAGNTGRAAAVIKGFLASR